MQLWCSRAVLWNAVQQQVDHSATNRYPRAGAGHSTFHCAVSSTAHRPLQCALLTLSAAWAALPPQTPALGHKKISSTMRRPGKSMAEAMVSWAGLRI